MIDCTKESFDKFMVFSYYNDTCSNETHFFFALGRGIESVKNGPQWHWGRYYLDIQRVVFVTGPDTGL